MATPPRPPAPLRRMIEQAYELPAWQRTEKEARIVALYELQRAEKAHTPPGEKRRKRR